MITLVIGQVNKVGLKVSAPEGLSGFSATLSACGTVKTAVTNDNGDASFVYSAADVARVTTDKQGEYGTLIITDATGATRIKALPCFIAAEEDTHSTDKDRTIFVSVPKKVNTPSSGGGGSVDPSVYATKQELRAAKEENKQYTDGKISDIGTTIISEQSVTVTGEDGQEQQMTVKQAMQNVVNMQSQVTQVVEHNVSWEVKDEDEDGQPDGEILYLTQSKKN